MPTAKYFNKYPPFPDHVPVAHLPRLSLQKLEAKDQVESERLFQACQDMGFFSVDLRGTGEGEAMLKDAERVYDLNEKVFETDQEELMRHAFKPPGCLFGYSLSNLV